MNPEDIVINERSQMETPGLRFHLQDSPETEDGLVVASGGGGEVKADGQGPLTPHGNDQESAGGWLKSCVYTRSIKLYLQSVPAYMQAGAGCWMALPTRSRAVSWSS